MQARFLVIILFLLLLSACSPINQAPLLAGTLHPPIASTASAFTKEPETSTPGSENTPASTALIPGVKFSLLAAAVYTRSTSCLGRRARMVSLG
jgi:hypothetical protein